jgi:hypothetical protein
MAWKAKLNVYVNTDDVGIFEMNGLYFFPQDITAVLAHANTFLTSAGIITPIHSIVLFYGGTQKPDFSDIKEGVVGVVALEGAITVQNGVVQILEKSLLLLNDTNLVLLGCPPWTIKGEWGDVIPYEG